MDTPAVQLHGPLADATRLVRRIEQAPLFDRSGAVVRLSGLLIEATGINASLGDMCLLQPEGLEAVPAEVVGFNQGRMLLMPYADCAGVGMGCRVQAAQAAAEVAVGDALLGRVVDAFGRPLDGLPAPRPAQRWPLKGRPLNPLQRPRIDELLETRVRAIDCFLPLGKGQRVGIFAGSGVGKSTLLGMIAREMSADVNVIALIGERGREVREFVDKCLGDEGLARSVLVVATSDQPAAVRVRAAHAATAIAEAFRAQGRDVLLTMDSITRFAMARREIGLSVGEPPTSRGYTPSVFAELPGLMERCGTAPGGGSITALYTVLVEGDDLNDPVADAARAILDGHIVLSRQLANQGHYPAIDLLASVSRLLPDLFCAADQELARTALGLLGVHAENRQMVEIGAYRAGSSPQLDQALRLLPQLQAIVRQGVDAATPREQAMDSLRRLCPPAALH
ncbi:MAG: FliI/YscN family ATPase [Aquabacterium sp.]|nr:MAG: FliI/YscN family ATPase [Aquabacterium sp.]